ncbi:all-trans-retinol 13,14-reductase isoform X3 [Anolis carolinensis]|uniref:all-trans-retinol 13,14-reductase isoform X3 n=1 Tax=Anolis carolinensis TaxID=28377 RepID=UPI002F2B261F
MGLYLLLGALLLLLLLLLGAVLVGFPGRPSRSPFQEDARRPPEPLVTDKEARKRVLKQGFSRDKVPDHLDAIVIGSGYGGLAVAVMLSKAGKRVLVLEQHGKAGGCCHTFNEKGYEFDVGIHYVGQMEEGSILRMMIDQLTDGQLQWAKMDSPFDTLILGDPDVGKRYYLHSGETDYIQGLKKQFPGEEAAIDRFVTLVKKVSKGCPLLAILKMLPIPLVMFLHRSGLLALVCPFFRMLSKNVLNVVAEITSNADLKAVFTYIFPTYGVIPSKASFSLHAILVEHFFGGGWYPQGGSSEIVFQSIHIIQRAGGIVLTKAPVQSILVDPQGKACGVSVKKGQDVVNIYAPVVISDAGIFNTYEKLLPNELKVLPGKSTLIILAVTKYEWFEEWKEEKVTKRGLEYESVKNSFVDSIMDTVLKVYPHIKDKIEHVSAGTPLTNCHYIASPRGEMYGAEHSISRLQVEVTTTIRPQTPVPNLYLTGQDVFLGGFPGALHGALICASAVLQRNLYVDLVRLRRKMKATSNKKEN